MTRRARQLFVSGLTLCGVAGSACFYAEPRDKPRDSGAPSVDSAPAPERPEASTPDAGELPCPDEAGCTIPRVVQIAAGQRHTCARLADETVRCWGYNDEGQLGDGTTTDRPRPIPIPGLAGIVEVALGAGHGCARTRDGAVYCWGSNSSGQLGDGTYEGRLAPVRVHGLPPVAQLAPGGRHTCARDLGGSVWCWGSNQSGQLGDGTTARRSLPTPVLGPEGTTAPDGGPGTLGRITRVAASTEYTCALDDSARVACWGGNGAGEIGVGAAKPFHTRPARLDWTGFLSLALGRSHACARMGDRVVRCWGDNTHLQLGTLTPHAAPETVPDLAPTTELWGGQNRTYARLEDGTMRAWGQLPLETVDAGPPTALPALYSVAELAVGDEHTCARLTDGTVRCWGLNRIGELGDGTVVSRTVPGPVAW